MKLSFPYQHEPLTAVPPPSLPAGATVRYRPLVPADILGPTGVCHFGRAVLDPGADDTVFPLTIAAQIGAGARHTGHGVRWRGQLYPLRFAQVELVLEDAYSLYRWPAMVGFSPAPLRYPILGIGGCLQFFDATFRGDKLVVELERNGSYPGTTS